MYVSDYQYKDGALFEDLLANAEAQADNSWAYDFVRDMQERFDEYGERTIVTDKQIAKLEEIAGWR